MLTGGLPIPQTQAIGTVCDSSITPGRIDKTLPCKFGFALLPMFMLITPLSTSKALIKLLTTLFGVGKPASLLSTGKVLSAFYCATSGSFAASAKGIAAVNYSLIMRSIPDGIAIIAKMPIIATTTIISIAEKTF